MCKCKVIQCSDRRCGCRKWGVSCSPMCECIGCLNGGNRMNQTAFYNNRSFLSGGIETRAFSTYDVPPFNRNNNNPPFYQEANDSLEQIIDRRPTNTNNQFILNSSQNVINDDISNVSNRRNLVDSGVNPIKESVLKEENKISDTVTIISQKENKIDKTKYGVEVSVMTERSELREAKNAEMNETDEDKIKDSIEEKCCDDKNNDSNVEQSLPLKDDFNLAEKPKEEVKPIFGINPFVDRQNATREKNYNKNPFLGEKEFIKDSNPFLRKPSMETSQIKDIEKQNLNSEFIYTGTKASMFLPDKQNDQLKPDNHFFKLKESKTELNSHHKSKNPFDNRSQLIKDKNSSDIKINQANELKNSPLEANKNYYSDTNMNLHINKHTVSIVTNFYGPVNEEENYIHKTISSLVLNNEKLNERAIFITANHYPSTSFAIDIFKTITEYLLMIFMIISTLLMKSYMSIKLYWNRFSKINKRLIIIIGLCIIIISGLIMHIHASPRRNKFNKFTKYKQQPKRPVDNTNHKLYAKSRKTNGMDRSHNLNSGRMNHKRKQ